MGVDVIAPRTPGRDRGSDQFQDLTEDDLDAFRRADIDMHQVAGPGTFWGGAVATGARAVSRARCRARSRSVHLTGTATRRRR